MDEMKVKPWGDGQGDHVRINVVDFDPERHAPLDEAEAAKVAHLFVRTGESHLLRDDGPTVEEFVAAGYDAVNYPPEGYASRSSPEAVQAAFEAQERAAEARAKAEAAGKAKESAAAPTESEAEGEVAPATKKPSEGLTVAQLREALKAQGLEFPSDVKKAELAELLDAAK